MGLSKIISIDEEKCVNCHQCIAVCSTKFANDGSGDVVKINDDLCIGCGECIKACTHEARVPVDDFESAMEALASGEKIVAVVAPAAASNFPEKYLHLNGWLKSLGVEAIFDVSFGAELTVKSYINYITKKKPKTIIAQPCPAIVTYIEVYRPELLQYLTPADSPMMHTLKMVKKFYPQYANHKLMVISPCLAKKREFADTGYADFNVTMLKLSKHIEDEKINLRGFPKTDFDNDPAERAVLFSTPGGLLATAEREVHDIRHTTRKIEGPHIIYRYLDSLPGQIEKGRAPLLVDCLNCENGCNGGTGTNRKDFSADELEFLIHERRKEMQERYQTLQENPQSISKLKGTIDKYWDESLYQRSYQNKHELLTSKIKKPSKRQIEKIYQQLHKYEEKDILNCASCGYDSCEMMAEAIYNGLNKIENCHFYLSYEHKQKELELAEKNNQIQEQKSELIEQSEHLLEFISKIREYAQK